MPLLLWLGGAIRTAEITEPGFVHEVFASWHPLFTGSAAYAELKDDLEARAIEHLNTELPTVTLFPDGCPAIRRHASGHRACRRTVACSAFLQVARE
jgi:phytoene dehydrogenase-like protein